MLSKVPHSIKVTSVMEQVRKHEEQRTKINPKERKKEEEEEEEEEVEEKKKY